MAEQVTMMSYSQDIKDAEKPKPLPAGQYRGVVRSAECKVSGKGKKYVAVVFNITPEQYPADFTDGNPEGTTMTWGRTSGEDTPQGRFSMKKLFSELGAPLPGKEVDLNQLLGREAILTTKLEMYQDDLNAQIDKLTKV